MTVVQNVELLFKYIKDNASLVKCDGNVLKYYCGNFFCETYNDDSLVTILHKGNKLICFCDDKIVWYRPAMNSCGDGLVITKQLVQSLQLSK